MRPRRERRRSPATSERAAVLAPDVEGSLGAEAIDVVRAKGLIAAIETVEIIEGARQGFVIEQDPPADTRMVREGVVTLRVARAPAEPQDTEDDDASEGQPYLSTTANGDGDREDDTAEWFATLGPLPGTPILGAGASAPRRRRKHRREVVPVKEMVFDTPPDPRPDICKALPNEHRDFSPQPVGPFTSAVATLLVWLSPLSVSSAWRRHLVVVAGAIAVVLVFTRGGGSHSSHQVSAPLAQVSISPLRAVTIQAPRHAQSMRRTARAQRRSRRPAARARRSPSGRASRKSIVATASAASGAVEPAGTVIPPARPTPATQSSPSTQVSQRPAPFIYLGK